jgi:hypothetical protein
VSEPIVHRYKNGTKYTLVPLEENKLVGPKRRGEEGVWVGTHWFPVLQLLDDDARVLPETRPDEETLTHRLGCLCDVCRRPEAIALWRRRMK